MPQPPTHRTGHHGPRYKVTHQEQDVEYTPAGTHEKTWTVHLEHENGVKGTVTLPDTQYTPENVHELASEQAQTVAAVGQLPDSVPAPDGSQAG